VLYQIINIQNKSSEAIWEINNHHLFKSTKMTMQHSRHVNFVQGRSIITDLKDCQN
jgi:hypothetical protein